MSELIVKNPEIIKNLIEYDFTFTSGMLLPFVVDEAAGDSVNDLHDTYEVTLVAKPNMLGEGDMLPREDIIIYKGNLAAVQRRYRQVRMVSPEEAAETKRMIHQMAKGVQ